MTPVLRADGITRSFGGVAALSEVSFDLAAGEVLGVIGPNGAGKSTLLGSLVGAPRASSGSLTFLDHDISRWPVHRRSRAGIARTHQIPRPLSSMTVRQNIHVASRGDDRSQERVQTIASRVGLGEHLEVASGMLNHADLRRLEVARAIAMNPRLLLLDEMGAGLTAVELDEFAALIRSVADDGVAVIVVEHIMELVMSVADRILVLDRGKMLALGTPVEVRANEEVVERYLGITS